MNRRTAVLASIVVTLLVGVGLFLYVSGADERAESNEALATAYVAATTIQRGTTFEAAFNDGAIAQIDMPARLIPETAIQDPEGMVGQLAVGNISSGLPIVTGQFATREQIGTPALGPNTFARQIPEGRVAVSFDAGPQVGGFIRPGDHVNLMIEVPNAALLDELDADVPRQIGPDGVPAASPGTAGPTVVHIFQDLEVVAVDQTPIIPIGAAPGTQVDPDAVVGGTGGNSYTVLVAPKDAARLIYLTNQYTVHLALLPPIYEATPVDPVDSTNALPEGLTVDDSAQAQGVELGSTSGGSPEDEGEGEG